MSVVDENNEFDGGDYGEDADTRNVYSYHDGYLAGLTQGSLHPDVRRIIRWRVKLAKGKLRNGLRKLFSGLISEDNDIPF
jgi:hypothetical protein